MAEEYVSKDQFGEFVRRMETGFHGIDQRFDVVDQRFSDLRRELDQRFGALERRMDELRQDMRPGHAGPACRDAGAAQHHDTADVDHD